MRKVFCVITIAFALSISGNLLAQTQNVPEGFQKPSRSAAVDINNSEIEALVRKMAADSVGDQAIRIVSVNDEYNLAIGVVSRLKTAPRKAPSAIEHSRITEIYHVISGSGTLVTGAILQDSREIPANDETVTLLNGPSKEGSGTGSAKFPQKKSSTWFCASIPTTYCPQATYTNRRRQFNRSSQEASG